MNDLPSKNRLFFAPAKSLAFFTAISVAAGRILVVMRVTHHT